MSTLERMTAMDLYLSPSLQPYNKYVGGGDEQTYMNKLADAMEPYLRASGVSFNRNRIGMTLGEAIRESNAGYYGLHLALHSNAAPESLSGKIRGADVYYYPRSKNGKRAAEIIAQNYKKIYPDPALVKTVPTTTLVEVTKTNAPAVLIETAYHDNLEDADWLRGHIPEIAKNLSESVAQYFGLPFDPNPQPPRKGTVNTQYGSLNIRRRPSVDAEVVATAPKGAQLTIWGGTPDWYVVEYEGTTGFADKNFVKLQ